MSAPVRYSKVSRRIWNDLTFRSLSAPPPNAQSLWMRLLTGPELTNIPGVIMAWEAGLAQALKWPLEAFREAFREVQAAGLVKANWEVGLVWVRKAFDHNKPESPNVVRSWSATWDIVPECELKTEIYRSLAASSEGLSKAYGQAFRETCPKPSPKAMANQEPEQEQEQEQEGETRGRAGAPRVRESDREPERGSGMVPARPREEPPSETVPVARPATNATDDGAFGMSVAAWAEGIRSVTGQPCPAPHGAEASRLVKVIAANCPSASDDRVDWAREAGAAYARAHVGEILNVFRFGDWQASGRPSRARGGPARVQPVPATGRAWKVGEEA